MNLQYVTGQIQPIKVNTPVFEGPLDLLLQLIERAELDITRLALAQVTDQYLTHMRALEIRIPEEVSAFLVIAAKLVQIKSEALLPRPPLREAGEEDPGVALSEQLRLYKQFKQAGEWLRNRDHAGLHTYLRIAPPPKIEPQLDLQGVTVIDLRNAARELFSRPDTRPDLKSVVTPSPVTIRERIGVIVMRLSQFGKTSFRSLMDNTRTRIEVVVTFLAMLELVKLRKISARQESLFGDIEMEPAEDFSGEIDFELEFGE